MRSTCDTTFVIPSAISGAATNITADSVTLHGTVNPNGLSTIGWFEWGTDPLLSSYNSSAIQPIGNGMSAIPISVTINGLTDSTKYFFRVVGSGIGGDFKWYNSLVYDVGHTEDNDRQYFNPNSRTSHCD